MEPAPTSPPAFGKVDAVIAVTILEDPAQRVEGVALSLVHESGAFSRLPTTQRAT